MPARRPAQAERARRPRRAPRGRRAVLVPRARGVRHWLFKSDPESYSIQDLARERRTCWDGVRNYQARNFLRDECHAGDLVLLHHSGGPDPAVVGVARVVRAGYPDPTAWQRGHPHFDSGSDPAAPTWYMVDIEIVQAFPEPLTMARLKGDATLAGMELLRRGSRLSVQPVGEAHFHRVLALAGVRL